MKLNSPNGHGRLQERNRLLRAVRHRIPLHKFLWVVSRYVPYAGAVEQLIGGHLNFLGAINDLEDVPRGDHAPKRAGAEDSEGVLPYNEAELLGIYLLSRGRDVGLELREGGLEALQGCVRQVRASTGGMLEHDELRAAYLDRFEVCLLFAVDARFEGAEHYEVFRENVEDVRVKVIGLAQEALP